MSQQCCSNCEEQDAVVAVPSAALKGTGVLSSGRLCGIKFNSLQSLVLQCVCVSQRAQDALQHPSHSRQKIYLLLMTFKAK